MHNTHMVENSDASVNIKASPKSGPFEMHCFIQLHEHIFHCFVRIYNRLLMFMEIKKANEFLMTCHSSNLVKTFSDPEVMFKFFARK